MKTPGFYLLLLFFFASNACAQANPSKQVSIHDPVLAKEGDTFYLFSTGPGITFYSSKDLIHWRAEGRVFPGNPSWALSVSPSFNGHIWAPDIIHHNNKFYLYYSVSAFGKNTSAMGVTVNKTLNPASADYQWEDQGIVLQSVPNRDDWNAIDPNIIFDEEQTPWMSFGSFWGGLKLVKLDKNMVDVAQPEEWYTIAQHENRRPNAVEAPFIFKKHGYYYLFVSWDLCCRRENSTYKLKVGRSKDVRGPYLDKAGQSLTEGGGSLLLTGDENYYGLGHNSAYTFDGQDYLVFHAYEVADNGLQKLKILEMSWDSDKWPIINKKDLNKYKSVLEE